MVPLAALFLFEETAFAATYTPPLLGGYGVGSGQAIATTATKTATPYILTSCVVTIGIIAAMSYVVLSDSNGVVAQKYDAEPTVTKILEADIPEDEPYIAYEPEPEEIIEEEIAEEPPEIEPPQEPEVEEEPDEPYIPYEPNPDPVDRTPQILAALATADTPEVLQNILSYYGFVNVAEIERSLGLRLRFYTTNEGSGDILIGISFYEDGSSWYMRFQLFASGTKPSDILQLLNFME